MAVELLIVLIEMSKLEGEIPQVLRALVPDLIKVLMDCMLDIQVNSCHSKENKKRVAQCSPFTKTLRANRVLSLVNHS